VDEIPKGCLSGTRNVRKNYIIRDLTALGGDDMIDCRNAISESTFAYSIMISYKSTQREEYE